MTYKIYTENSTQLIDAPTIEDALTIFRQTSDAEVIGVVNVDKFNDDSESVYESGYRRFWHGRAKTRENKRLWRSKIKDGF